MPLSLTAPTPLEYFQTLVRSDQQFLLLEAAISLGQDEYPQLDVQAVLAEFDHLLARLKRRIPLDAPALHKLRLLNQFFYRDLKFAGNVNNYYDPANSYLSVVLRRRRGIPISLAVLWLELAQGLDLAAQGVGFPGHFMVKVNLPLGQVVIDPFSGESLSREVLSERLEATRTHRVTPDEDIPLGLYLQSMPPRNIIARMLHNLKEIHRAQEDWPRLLAVQDRLVALLPEAWTEYRDRGLTHAQLGHLRQAVADLETYLAHAPDGVDIALVSTRVSELRQIR